jgi:outer membrane protein assembly factor BamD (BamD/ComL family)
MMSATVILSGLLMGLWPFGDAANPANEGIGSLAREEVVLDTEKTVKADANRAREHYARYLELETAADPAMRAIALRRLGDLTLEQAESRLLEEGLTDSVTSNFSEAESLYKAFLDEYPDDPAAGRVLYQLARTVDLKGETEKSLSTLDRLVDSGISDADNEQAALLAEAQFRRGETLFSAHDWHAAELAYAAVMSAEPRSSFIEQATYKHGWSLFKQGRHEESLDSFFVILDERVSVDDVGRTNLDSLERPARELVDDTLRAVCIGFAYMDGPDSLTQFLAERSDTTSYDRLIFVRLGELYLEQERYHDAAASYRAYVENRPGDDSAPQMQILVVEAFEVGNFPALVLESKIEYVELFGADSSYWIDHDWATAVTATDYLRTSLDELARHFHATAQASGDPDDFAAAARWYESWLAAFADEPEASEVHFLLAELRFEAHQYEAAALAYEQTAYGYGDHKRAAEAGYAALLAWRQKSDAEPEGPWRGLGIDSSLRFASTFPDHEQAAAVRADASQELFELGRLEDAAAAAIVLVRAAGSVDNKHRKTALLVLGHASFDLGDFSTAESAYGQTLLLLDSEDETKNTIRERLAASIYSQATAASAAGDAEMAVAHFARVRQSVPDSPIAATADYDATVLMMETGDWQGAATLMTEFRERYPGHEYEDRVTVNLATAWIESGNELEAARELVQVSRLDGEDADVRRAALWQAAGLYQESGVQDAAEASWSEYVERYPAPLDPAMEARQTLVDLHKKRGNPAGSIEWLQAIVAADRAAGELATGRSKTLAANAVLELAEPDRQAFDTVVLSSPLEKSLKRKKNLMEKALAGYARAADYGITDVTTEASYHVAEIYRHFGLALMESERPAELDAAALEEYEFLLEEQAFPFEEQAISIHEKNTERTRNGVYDEWVAGSFTQLAALVPGRYARNEKGEHLVRLAY